MAQLFPSKYRDLPDELKIHKEDYSFVREVLAALKNFDSKVILNIRGFPSRQNSLPFVVLDERSGITIFTSFHTTNLSFNTEIFIALLRQASELRDKAISVLGSHRQLQIEDEDSIRLTIPVRIIPIFPFLSASKATDKLKSMGLEPDEFRILYRDTKKDHFQIRRFLELTEIGEMKCSSDDLNAALQMIAPEYIIPKFFKIKRKIAASPGEVSNLYKVDFSYDEKITPSFRLTKTQVNLANNVKKGNWLLLSCAGSGKSVIILARAIKLARMYPDKKILITFYNNSLASFYQWRLECAGVNDRNITCKTFHSLCKEILIENNMSDRVPNGLSEEEHWEYWIKQVSDELIATGTLRTRFDFIFIDEIQDFAPHWYRVCYEMLADHSNYILNIAGDITQDIRGRVRKDVTPWRGEDLPKYTGRSTRIEINYRNSVEVNRFATSFNILSNKWALANNVELNEDDFLIGRSRDERGHTPKVVLIDKSVEAKKIVETVMLLKEQYKVAYSDMLICYPFKQMTQYYAIEYWISQELQKEGIPFDIVGERNRETAKYWNYSLRGGVTMSPIGKAKGLDFEAVIVCGLFALENQHQVKTHEDILKNMKRIYTAATRAKKYLYIISSASKEKEVITAIALRAEKGEGLE